MTFSSGRRFGADFSSVCTIFSDLAFLSASRRRAPYYLRPGRGFGCPAVRQEPLLPPTIHLRFAVSANVWMTHKSYIYTYALIIIVLWIAKFCCKVRLPRWRT